MHITGLAQRGNDAHPDWIANLITLGLIALAGPWPNNVMVGYPVDRVDLTKWFSPEELAAVQAQRCQHARFLASIGG